MKLAFRKSTTLLCVLAGMHGAAQAYQTRSYACSSAQAVYHTMSGILWTEDGTGLDTQWGRYSFSLVVNTAPRSRDKYVEIGLRNSTAISYLPIMADAGIARLLRGSLTLMLKDLDNKKLLYIGNTQLDPVRGGDTIRASVALGPSELRAAGVRYKLHFEFPYRDPHATCSYVSLIGD